MDSKSEEFGLDSSNSLDSNSQIVVGGKKFKTTRSTLEKSGYFKALLSNKFGDKQDDGSFFIDRDGYYFKYLLNYMRCGYVAIPSKEAAIIQLEARFFQINLDLTDIVQRMTLPELEVCIEWTIDDRFKITINGDRLQEVYANFKMSQEEHAKYDRSRRYHLRYTGYEFIIKHLRLKCGYSIHQQGQCKNAYKEDYRIFYVLRPAVPDTVIVSTK